MDEEIDCYFKAGCNTNPNKLLFESPQPNLLPLEKG